MKTIGASLLSHLQGVTTTLADLWKVTRRDGQVFGFTSLDADLYYDGVLYQASSAWSASSVAQETSTRVGNLEITGYLSSAQITREDCEAGTWDGAAVEMWRVNYADLRQGHEIVAKGELGQVRLSDGQLVVELRGFMQKLQNEVGRVFKVDCDADLGDARCGVSLSAFTSTGTVTSVTSRAVFADSSLGETDGYFQFGLLTWDSGANAGRQMEVKEYTAASGTVELQLPMVGTVAVGDEFTIVAGCNKQFATCLNTFSNAVNFRGFHLVPGLHRIISGQ